MKRSIVAISLVLVGGFAFIGLHDFKRHDRDGFAIEVMNNSNGLLGKVHLRGIGEVGDLGTMSTRGTKRVTLLSGQAREDISLSFERPDQIERSTGTILPQDSNPGGQLIRMQVTADHSVSVERLDLGTGKKLN